MTSHILLCMLWHCFREEGVATIYNSSYTKKVQSILYAYSYVLLYITTHYIQFVVFAIVVEEYTVQLLKVSP